MTKALHLLPLTMALLWVLAPAPPAVLKTVSLEAADGVRLAASGGVVKASTRGILFLPDREGRKEDWQGVAEAALRQGYSVVSVDLRGQGANIVGEPRTLSSEDYYAMTRDGQAGGAWLRAQGVQRLAVVGAGLGANLGIRVAADDPTFQVTVLVSPGIEYNGITTRDAVQRYGARPLMNISGQQDSYSARAATALDSLATGPKNLLLLPTSAHGTALLNRDPSLPGAILGFISLHLKS
ncbi:MAG TPA: alpha/beta hydrolase [Myxococcota bacterium]|nr:alpha/beta hydrolase [Myxococcota bacterium]HND29016.1 alpha/beta hydrolase [Myxococcota bacterium]